MTADVLRKFADRPWIWIAGFMLLSAAFVAITVRFVPDDKLTPDFIAFWTGAQIVSTGGNPYDPVLQSRIQQSLGWNRERDGLGIYDFLPYNYPPWLALPTVPLVPIGFKAAKVMTYFVNMLLLFMSAYFVSRAARGVPRVIPLFVVPLFILCPISLLMGQTAILMLFLAALEWKCLEEGRDRAAGVALAFLTTKPHLGGLLVLSLLLWAARQRRWQVVQGFAIMMSFLAISGVWVVWDWPLEFARAISAPPPPTAYFPWMGTTWLLLLRTSGLKSWVLWAAYVSLAVPFLGLVIKAALDRSRPASDVIALAILALFIVSPYGRQYDFPILLIPLFVLMGGRLPEPASASLMVALLVLPYFHYAAMIAFRETVPTYLGSQRVPDCTFLWVPAVLTATWLAYEARRARGTRPVPVLQHIDGRPSPSEAALDVTPLP